MSAEAARRRSRIGTLAIRQQLLEVDGLPPLRVSRLRQSILACWRLGVVQMTMTRLSLAFTFSIRDGNKKTRSQGQKLTRLKSPFGRLLHLFLVPECDFNLGYQSADEVVNDFEPERNPTTALSREVAEVEEKNMIIAVCFSDQMLSHPQPCLWCSTSTILDIDIPKCETHKKRRWGDIGNHPLVVTLTTPQCLAFGTQVLQMQERPPVQDCQGWLAVPQYE